MIRRFVAAALVVVQAAAWAGGSLQVCVASDGSVALDCGPAHCTRGHRHAALAAAPCKQDEGAARMHERCECRHWALGMACLHADSRNWAADVASQILVDAPVAPVGVAPELNLALRDVSALPAAAFGAAARALFDAASIVLRC